MDNNTNFNSTNSAESKLNQIDWDSISLEELLDILDRLGAGYYSTVKYIISKLKGQKGQIGSLMYWIKSFGLGKPGASKSAKTKLAGLKKTKKISPPLSWALFILIARHEKKFNEKPNLFENYQNLSFKPANPNFNPAYTN